MSVSLSGLVCASIAGLQSFLEIIMVAIIQPMYSYCILRILFGTDVLVSVINDTRCYAATDIRCLGS